jgi:hypothetical protein
MPHKVYMSIVEAVRDGRLKEPFSTEDFRTACPGFAPDTYGVFLPKHRRGNPGGNSELFECVRRGTFRCLRPFRYGL